MHNPNGWQRLWVVLTGGWLVVVAVALLEERSRPIIVNPDEVEAVSGSTEWVFEVTAPGRKTIRIKTRENLPPTRAELEQIFKDIQSGYISNDPYAGTPLSENDPILRDPRAGTVLSAEPNADTPIAPEQPIWSIASGSTPVQPNIIRATTPEGVIEFPVATPTDKVLALYEQKVARNTDAIHRTRRQNAFTLVAWATVPPIVLLVIGYSIAWVYRGFRPRGVTPT